MKQPKPLELPPEVAREFVEAMNDYFAEEDKHRRDAVAAHQLKRLQRYLPARAKPLRLSDVRELFEVMNRK